MRALAITGVKKSGKTSLLGLVAQALESKGHTVAILKYTTHSLEQANSDVFWLMRPERTVIALAPEETTVIWPRALSFDALVSMVSADVLLIEGGSELDDIPRILCFRDGGEEEAALLASSATRPGPVLASVGGEPPKAALRGEYPHYEDVGPEAADALAALAFEKGLELRGEQ